MSKSVGVASAVESILKEAPAADEAVKETPSKEAPASQPSDKGKSVSEATGKSSESAAEHTAFEQELIAELDEEGKNAFEASTPEQQRRFLVLAKKSYRQNSKEMTELGTLRKAVGALQDAGVTNEDLVKLVQEKRGGTKAEAKAVVDSATNGKGSGKRGYQRLLDQAKTAEEREDLTDIQQVLREEFEDLLAERLDKRLKPMEDRLALSDRERHTKRASGLEQEINDLEDKHGYPGSLVETHREAMHRLGLREPELSVEDLLVRVAGFKTVKAALDKMKQKAEESETLVPGGRAAPVVKKPAPVPLATDRKGRLSVMEAARNLLRPSK